LRKVQAETRGLAIAGHPSRALMHDAKKDALCIVSGQLNPDSLPYHSQGSKKNRAVPLVNRR